MTATHRAQRRTRPLRSIIRRFGAAAGPLFIITVSGACGFVLGVATRGA